MIRAKYSYEGVAALKDFSKSLEQYNRLIEAYKSNFAQKVNSLQELGAFQDEIMGNIDLINKSLSCASDCIKDAVVDCICFTQEMLDEIGSY